MVKSFKENLKTGAKAFAFLLILAMVMSIFSGNDSDEKQTTVVDNTNIKAIELNETGVSVAQAEEIPAETPEPEVTQEQKKSTSLEDAKVEAAENTPRKSESSEEAYQAKLKEQEEEETPDEVETPESTVSSSDMVWISTMLSDMSVVQKDMTGLGKAATNNDMVSLKTYTDRLSTSTETAIDDSDKYTVSSDLTAIQKEYRQGMVSYNAAAMACYGGLEAYNSGDMAGFQDSFSTATDLLNAGTERITKCTKLVNEYNEEHS
ncbi:MAG: hypothetical protein ACP5N0_13040 [Methanosarcina sp.]